MIAQNVAWPSEYASSLLRIEVLAGMMADTRQMLGDAFHESDAWLQTMAFVRLCEQTAGQYPESDAAGLSKKLLQSAVDLPPSLAAAFVEPDDKSFEQALSKIQRSLQQLDAVILMSADMGLLKPKVIKTIRRACVELANTLEHEKP